jgi:hypothetical protein
VPVSEVTITGKEGAEEKEKDKAEEPKEPTLQEKVKQAIGLICELSSVPRRSHRPEADSLTEQTSTRPREFCSIASRTSC